MKRIPIRAILVLILALIATASAQFIPNTTPPEITLRGYVAEVVSGLLPAGHPNLMQTAVSPDGQWLAYEGKSAIGEQALYLLRLTDPARFWKFLGTAKTIGAHIDEISLILKTEGQFQDPNPANLNAPGQLFFAGNHLVVGIVAQGGNQQYNNIGAVSINLTDNSMAVVLSPFVTYVPGSTLCSPIAGHPDICTPNPVFAILRPNAVGDRVFTGHYTEGIKSASTAGGEDWQLESKFGMDADVYKRLRQIFPIGQNKLLMDTGNKLWLGDRIPKDSNQLLVDPNNLFVGGQMQTIADPSGTHVFCWGDVMMDWRYPDSTTSQRAGKRVIYFDLAKNEIRVVTTDSDPEQRWQVTPVAVSKAGAIIADFYNQVGDVELSDGLIFYDGSKRTFVVGPQDSVFGHTLGYRIPDDYPYFRIPGSIYQSMRVGGKSAGLTDDGTIVFVAAFSDLNGTKVTNYKPAIVKFSKPTLEKVTVDSSSMTITGTNLSIDGVFSTLTLDGQEMRCSKLTSTEATCSVPEGTSVGNHSIAVKMSDIKGKTLSSNQLSITLTIPSLPKPAVSQLVAQPATVKLGQSTNLCFVAGPAIDTYRFDWTARSGKKGLLVSHPPTLSQASDGKSATVPICEPFTPDSTTTYTLTVSNGQWSDPVDISVAVDSAPTVTNVTAATNGPDITPGNWVLISGTSFTTTAVYPDSPSNIVGGVAVKLTTPNGDDWYVLINAVEPTVIGGLIPTDFPPGVITVTVINESGQSQPFKITVNKGPE